MNWLCFLRHRVYSQDLRITGVTETLQSVHTTLHNSRSISRRVSCDVMVGDCAVRRYGAYIWDGRVWNVGHSETACHVVIAGLKVKVKVAYTAVNGIPSHSYGVSLAV